MGTTDIRRIEHVPLADLLAARHPRNPKDHDLPGIEASFARFGFTMPVLLCERSGLIAAGHGRLAALEARAARQGTPDAPGAPAGVVTNDDGGAWGVPTVRGWSSANDEELLAYVLADNFLGPKGGWTDKLAAELAELLATGTAIPPGLDSDDVDTLLAELGAGELAEGETDADYADDLSGRGAPATPREVQGLHEVGLMFQAEAHAEYQKLLQQLRLAWGSETPTPVLVLRALRQAVDGL